MLNARLTAGDGVIGSLEPVPLPPWARHTSPGLNPDFNSKTLRFTAESPAHTEHSYDYRYDCCDACRPSPASLHGLYLKAHRCRILSSNASSVFK